MPTVAAKPLPQRLPNRFASASEFIRLRSLPAVEFEVGTAPPGYALQIAKAAERARELVLDTALEIGRIEGDSRLSDEGRAEDRAAAIASARVKLSEIEIERDRLTGLHDGAATAHASALGAAILKFDPAEAMRASEIRNGLRALSLEARKNAIFGAVASGDTETLRALAAEPGPQAIRLVATESMRNLIAGKLIEIAAPADLKATGAELEQYGEIVRASLTIIDVARAAFRLVEYSRA